MVRGMHLCRPMVLRSLYVCTILLLAWLSDARAVEIHLIGMGTPSAVTRDRRLAGPVRATVDGVSTLLYCNDLSNGAYFGQTWQANLTLITPDSDLTST